MARLRHHTHALDLIKNITSWASTFEQMRYANPHLTGQASVKKAMHEAIDKYFEDFEKEFLFGEEPEQPKGF